MRISDTGLHRTIIPSQSGRQCNMRKQFQARKTYCMWKVSDIPEGGMKYFYNQLQAQHTTQQTTMQMNRPMMMPVQSQGQPPLFQPNALQTKPHHATNRSTHVTTARDKNGYEHGRGMVTTKGGEFM